MIADEKIDFQFSVLFEIIKLLARLSENIGDDIFVNLQHFLATVKAYADFTREYHVTRAGFTRIV